MLISIIRATDHTLVAATKTTNTCNSTSIPFFAHAMSTNLVVAQFYCPRNKRRNCKHNKQTNKQTNQRNCFQQITKNEKLRAIDAVSGWCSGRRHSVLSLWFPGKDEWEISCIVVFRTFRHLETNIVILGISHEIRLSVQYEALPFLLANCLNLQASHYQYIVVTEVQKSV